MITDSRGPRAFRGGLGMCETVTPMGHDAVVGIETSRSKEGPPGVEGGQCRRPGRSMRHSGRADEEITGGKDGTTWKICTFARWPLRAGDTFTIEAPGRGGSGDPLMRDPRLVLEDVLDEDVSVEGAARDYGVVIDGIEPDVYVDDAATAARRATRVGVRQSID